LRWSGRPPWWAAEDRTDKDGERNLSQDEAESAYVEAQEAERRGRVEEAEVLYKRFQELKPNDPRGPNKLGVLRALLGEFDAAQQQFQAALDLDPKFPPALTNMGNIFLEQGNAEEAVRLYEEALTIDPNYSPAHHNMAAALKKLGRIRPMVQHLKDAQKAFRDTERESVRKEMSGCMSRGGKTTVLLVAVGLLHVAAFWR